MAKVTESKAGKAQGVAPEPKKTIGIIHAMRNGQKREFTRLLWDHLPSDKEGWKEISDKPKEPEQKEEVDHSKKEGSEKTNKKILTQEDLDLNPDLAIQGLKVGDEVELEEEEDGQQD